MTLTLRSRSKVKVKFCPKWLKNQRTGHILETISSTHFILGTKVQPNKAHSMTQVSMTLTQGRSRSKVKVKFSKKKKRVKNQRTGHISKAISPIHFILGTKVHPNKKHSMIQVPMYLTQGQSQRSRSNFSKISKKPKNMSYLGGYFTYRLHTWYQGTSYYIP